MTEHRGAKPIVVGIDGSKAAVRAAIWGAAEARQHDVALKLLCVIDRDRAGTPKRRQSAAPRGGRRFARRVRRC